MIVYYHPSSVKPPPFLEGAHDVCARQAVRGGCFFGIGPIYLCGFDEQHLGVDLSDGWKAHIVGALDPYVLQRDLAAQPCIGMTDMEGRIWQVPIIQNAAGRRAFPVRYGPDFAPIFSQEQKTLMAFATEARNILPRLVDADDDERDELLPVACRYAAKAVAYKNHLSEEVVLKLGILDTALVVGTLTALCSYLENAEVASA